MLVLKSNFQTLTTELVKKPFQKNIAIKDSPTFILLNLQEKNQEMSTEIEGTISYLTNKQCS